MIEYILYFTLYLYIHIYIYIKLLVVHDIVNDPQKQITLINLAQIKLFMVI